MKLEAIKQVKGTADPVPGDDIDTDRIIPARYLKCVTFDGLGLALFFDERFGEGGKPLGHPVDAPEYRGARFIISGNNFGCGSSREHAPFAMNKAGVKIVVAESFARIFYRNSIDGGFLIPVECKEKIFDKCRTGSHAEIDLEKYEITIDGAVFKLNSLGDVGPIIEAGGLFEYARKSEMI